MLHFLIHLNWLQVRIEPSLGLWPEAICWCQFHSTGNCTHTTHKSLLLFSLWHTWLRLSQSKFIIILVAKTLYWPDLWFNPLYFPGKVINQFQLPFSVPHPSSLSVSSSLPAAFVKECHSRAQQWAAQRLHCHQCSLTKPWPKEGATLATWSALFWTHCKTTGQGGYLSPCLPLYITSLIFVLSCVTLRCRNRDGAELQELF